MNYSAPPKRNTIQFTPQNSVSIYIYWCGKPPKAWVKGKRQFVNSVPGLIQLLKI